MIRLPEHSFPVEKRIGLLDRKLRIVSENTTTTREWLEAAKDAYTEHLCL